MPTRIALGVLTVVATIIYMANRPIQIPMFYDFFIKPFKQALKLMVKYSPDIEYVAGEEEIKPIKI